ncbi:MAG: metal-dependent hydrolase [Candidatus Hodarchaeota archaeon]
MPPISIHALVGIGLASKVDNPKLKITIAFGTVLPDTDLLASVVLYLLTGDLDIGKMFHRTITHSLLIHLILFLIGWGVMRIGKGWQGVLLMIIAAGTAVHTSMDFAYMAYMTHDDARNNVELGVALFWPLTDSKFAIWEAEVDNKTYNILIATDFLCDPILYFLPLLWLAFKRNTDSRFRKPLIIISFIDGLIMTGFTLLALFGSLMPDDFIFYSYIPGVFAIILAVSFPLLLRETIGTIRWGQPWISPSFALESDIKT